MLQPFRNTAALTSSTCINANQLLTHLKMTGILSSINFHEANSLVNAQK